jgi:hypothetical protein
MTALYIQVRIANMESSQALWPTFRQQRTRGKLEDCLEELGNYNERDA